MLVYAYLFITTEIHILPRSHEVCFSPNVKSFQGFQTDNRMMCQTQQTRMKDYP